MSPGTAGPARSTISIATWWSTTPCASAPTRRASSIATATSIASGRCEAASAGMQPERVPGDELALGGGVGAGRVDLLVRHAVEQRREGEPAGVAQARDVGGGVLHDDEQIGEALAQLAHQVEPALRAGGVAGPVAGGGAMLDDLEVVEEEAVDAQGGEAQGHEVDQEALVVGVAHVHPGLVGVAVVGAD